MSEQKDVSNIVKLFRNGQDNSLYFNEVLALLIQRQSYLKTTMKN